MTNREVNLLYLLAFVVVIGVMSWRDMNPRPVDYTNMIVYPYYAGADITSPKMVPDDSQPLTIGIGSFSYTTKGKAIWMAEGLPPSTFAQRQVALQFRFNNLPHTPEQTKETLDRISSEIDAWEHQGDNIPGFMLEYTAEKPDLKAYRALYDAVFSQFHTHYTVIPSVIPDWEKGKDNALYAAMTKDIGQVLFVVPRDWDVDTLLARAGTFSASTIFQLPASITPDVLNARIKKEQTPHNFVLTLNPNKPIVQKTDKVGLFPKF